MRHLAIWPRSRESPNLDRRRAARATPLLLEDGPLVWLPPIHHHHVVVARWCFLWSRVVAVLRSRRSLPDASRRGMFCLCSWCILLRIFLTAHLHRPFYLSTRTHTIRWWQPWFYWAVRAHKFNLRFTTLLEVDTNRPIHVACHYYKKNKK